MVKFRVVILIMALLGAGCGASEDASVGDQVSPGAGSSAVEVDFSTPAGPDAATGTDPSRPQPPTLAPAESPGDGEVASALEAEPGGIGAAGAATASSGADGSTIVATAITPVVVARSGPSTTATELASFNHPRALGGPLVFQVIGFDDGPWLEVKLPMRPNGATGWIDKTSVALSANPYHIEIDVSEHRLVFRRDGQPILDTTVAIGTGTTPTPRGSFYLTDLVQPVDPGGPYGSYAYGLSGFSETLESFNGGDGVIGIHGTNDPSSLGSDVSHGCVRLHNDEIEQLVALLPLGTPVDIVD